MINIQGIGSKTEEKLNKLDIYETRDLIELYPRKYVTLPEPVSVINASIGKDEAVCIKVVKKPFINTKTTTLSLKDDTGEITAVWFQSPFFLKEIKVGQEYVLYGKINMFNGKKQITQAQIYPKDEYYDLYGKMRPIYPLTEGIKQPAMRRYIQRALDNVSLEEYLPEGIRRENGLMNYEEAIKQIHNPENEYLLRQAKNRLIFDEFFKFMLGVHRYSSKKISNHCPMTKRSVLYDIIKRLPFQLTNAQLNTWKDIESDTTSEVCMVRLVQGDVSCGKTIVAFLAAFFAVENFYQAAIMAPTEVLATQHYEEMHKLIKQLQLPYKCVLLTRTTKNKKTIQKEIKTGEINIVIGTHAIIQEPIEYKNLGLVVTDEQHRFGVRQIQQLKEKGCEPHTLMMSATPIPRSLGLIMYGNMSISIIDELPANRLPNKNLVLKKSESMKAWKFIYEQIQKGYQAYVICPMVEENDKLDVSSVTSYTESMKKSFPVEINIEALHGKMSPEQKNEVMERFAKNETQILVATTVVEVGVNVPNATVMMIEDAERFGLSQLHQLRGRVGRGGLQGYCIFISGKEEESERLNTIRSTNNGFEIAEADFKLRGMGDLTGEKQTGDPRFKIADMYRDSILLEKASSSAKELLDDNPELTGLELLKKHI